MKRIGVRELRQQASQYLREVERGEIIEISERGRPVARLVPLHPRSRRDELIASGQLIPGNGRDILEIEPAKPAPGVPPLSDILAEMRRDER